MVQEDSAFQGAFEDFALYLDEMAECLLDSLNALQVKELEEKPEIVQVYLDTIHSCICADLRAFWDHHHESLGNFNLIHVSQWCSGYAEKLKVFLLDERLAKGR